MMGTFGLGFNALPNVFARCLVARFFGFVWFFMLFLAAITSSLSMLQPVIAFFEEGLGHEAARLGDVPGIDCSVWDRVLPLFLQRHGRARHDGLLGRHDF